MNEDLFVPPPGEREFFPPLLTDDFAYFLKEGLVMHWKRGQRQRCVVRIILFVMGSAVLALVFSQEQAPESPLAFLKSLNRDKEMELARWVEQAALAAEGAEPQPVPLPPTPLAVDTSQSAKAVSKRVPLGVKVKPENPQECMGFSEDILKYLSKERAEILCKNEAKK